MSSKRSASIAELRHAARDARRSVTADERAAASERISATVIRSHEFLAAKSVACYLPMHEEVDPTRIIARAWRAKKRVFAPVIDLRGRMRFIELRQDTVLRRNQFDLWEPVGNVDIAPQLLDLVLTPLVAFDSANNRIGMGGGYFDRCFAFLKNRHYWCKPKLVGLAFNCQRVEKIEPNPWDIPLYSIVTETE